MVMNVIAFTINFNSILVASLFHLPPREKNCVNDQLMPLIGIHIVVV